MNKFELKRICKLLLVEIAIIIFITIAFLAVTLFKDSFFYIACEVANYFNKDDSSAESLKTKLSFHSSALICIGNQFDDYSLFTKPPSQAGLTVSII